MDGCDYEMLFQGWIVHLARFRLIYLYVGVVFGVGHSMYNSFDPMFMNS